MQNTPKPFRLQDGSLDLEAICSLAAGLYLFWHIRDQIPEAFLMFKGWPPLLLTISGLVAGTTVRHAPLFRAIGHATAATVVFTVLYPRLSLGAASFLASGWSSLLIVLGFGIAAYYAVAHFNDWRRRDAAADDAEEGSEDARSRPMMSLVLLSRQGRFMEAPVLARIIEEAWGGDYTSEGESGKSGFVAGEKPIFMVKTPLGMFIIHFMESQYWENTEGLADEVEDLRLRQAILDHQAWLSVDLIGPADESVTDEVAYSAISRLIYELVDEDVLAILKPATGQVNIWNDDVAERLLRPDGPERFNERTVDPVLRVDSNDPRMEAAVATARERWPDFVEAFRSRSSDDLFLVKAPITVEERTEFIWTEVHGLEPDYIHGTLANQPVRLGDLREGSTVEIAVAEMNDWAYIKGGETCGFFTNQVIAEQLDERQ